MRIVVDAFGGDNSPSAQVEGSVAFVNEQKEVDIVLTGDKAQIEAVLAKCKYDPARLTVVHAPDVVTNDDPPATAVRIKRDSSLARAFDLLKENDDVAALVSSGSTGAVLSGAILRIGRIRGVSRPALAPVLPTATGGQVCLIDCGANMDSRPEFLVHFALMGVEYMRLHFGIANPRVGLLSVGVEDHKGNELTKTVFGMLKELPIEFAGNLEARDALSGQYDVIVTDGFAGNVLLKTAEGTASFVMHALKDAVMSSASAKIGYLFMKKAFRSLKGQMDYQQFGGAPFLGVQKVVIKGHGSGKPIAVTIALRQAAAMAKADVCGGIKKALDAVDAPAGADEQ